MQTVQGIIRVQAFAIDRQIFGRRSQERLQGVLQRAAILGFRLAQLVNHHDFRLHGVAPLAIDFIVSHQLDVSERLAADGVEHRIPHRILAGSADPGVQDGMVHLDVRVLALEGHDVQHMLALVRVGQHPLDVLQPRRHVTRSALGAGVTPAIRVHQPVTGAQHRLTGSERDASQ